VRDDQLSWQRSARVRKQAELFCSFCGKSQHVVERLIAGPKVFICDECVGICINILGEDRDWCSREIGNLRRLRRQARAKPQEAPSLQEQSARGGGFWQRLWPRGGT
jgi:hypothetical protein